MNAYNDLMDRFLGYFSEEELEVIQLELNNRVRSKLTANSTKESAVELVQEIKAMDKLFSLFRDYQNSNYQGGEE